MKAAAGVLISVVMSLILSRHGKDYAIAMVICVCCMIAVSAINYLQDVIGFVEELLAMGDLSGDLVGVLLKTVGIGLLSEMTTAICNDSGNAALGKAIHTLSAAISLWLCIPLFTKLLQLIEGVLGRA